jgi:hypothetical protein
MEIDQAKMSSSIFSEILVFSKLRHDGIVPFREHRLGDLGFKIVDRGSAGKKVHVHPPLLPSFSLLDC